MVSLCTEKEHAEHRGGSPSSHHLRRTIQMKDKPDNESGAKKQVVKSHENQNPKLCMYHWQNMVQKANEVNFNI